MRSHEDDMFRQGETMITIIQNPQSNAGCKKKLNHISGCWLLEIIRPSSKDGQILLVKILKNFDYRYYLLTIYTSQQQFYLH